MPSFEGFFFGGLRHAQFGIFQLNLYIHRHCEDEQSVDVAFQLQ